MPRSVAFLVGLVIFLLIAGVLYMAQAILIPIALAILITFLLTPVVKVLQKWGLPRIASVVLVVGVSLAMVVGVGGLIAAQIYDLAQEMPEHKGQIKQNVSRITRWIVGPPTEQTGGDKQSVAGLITDVKKDVVEQIEQSTKSEGEGDGSFLGFEPIEVKVVEPDSLVPEYFTTLASQVVGPLGTAGLVVVLVLFMLVMREDLRNRIVTLSGRSHLAVTTQALDEAARRISRYLLMQFVINVTYGCCVTVGIFFIGVEYAALWGVCAALFRYVPYIGPWIAATLPIGYSLLTSGYWLEPILVISLVIVLELLSNNVMEPWLYGRGVGVSTAAVILGVMFWGWLWGPVGFVLATPLTACLVVAGRYMPALSLFNRFLGDVPEVEAHIIYYQRLLARDEDEAQELFDDHVRETSLAQTCERFLVPTLSSLKRDRMRGTVSGDQLSYIFESIEEHLEEAADEKVEPDVERPAEDVPLFLGYGVRDPEDEAAAKIASALAPSEGCRFEILSNDMLASEVLERIRAEAPAAVCLFSLPPGGMTRTRRVCKRWLAACPDLRIVLCRWGRGLSEKQRQSLQELGVVYVTTTPTETREQMQSIGRLRRPSVGADTGEIRPGGDDVSAGAARGA